MVEKFIREGDSRKLTRRTRYFLTEDEVFRTLDVYYTQHSPKLFIIVLLAMLGGSNKSQSVPYDRLHPRRPGSLCTTAYITDHTTCPPRLEAENPRELLSDQEYMKLRNDLIVLGLVLKLKSEANIPHLRLHYDFPGLNDAIISWLCAKGKASPIYSYYNLAIRRVHRNFSTCTGKVVYYTYWIRLAAVGNITAAHDRLSADALEPGKDRKFPELRREYYLDSIRFELKMIR